MTVTLSLAVSKLPQAATPGVRRGEHYYPSYTHPLSSYILSEENISTHGLEHMLRDTEFVMVLWSVLKS